MLDPTLINVYYIYNFLVFDSALGNTVELSSTIVHGNQCQIQDFSKQY